MIEVSVGNQIIRKTAEVDNNGKVTTVKEGEARIIVKTKNGNKTAFCKVIINAKVISVIKVSLNKDKLILTEGESDILRTTMIPKNATNKGVS